MARKRCYAKHPERDDSWQSLVDCPQGARIAPQGERIAAQCEQIAPQGARNAPQGMRISPGGILGRITVRGFWGELPQKG